MSEWVQPKENTLPSLSHAIDHMDGIEFDIRATSDGELMVHHDRILAVSEELRDGLPKYFELNTSDDIEKLGFPSLRQLLTDPVISSSVKEQGKVMCIELKLPHPSSKVAGTWLNPRKNLPFMQNILSQASNILKEENFPKQNIIFYSFYRNIYTAAKNIDFDWAVSALRPVLPHFGGTLVQKAWVLPEFMTQTLKYRIKKQRRAGSPMVPCALEYLVPPTNWVPFGRRLGLEGKPLTHLTRTRSGYPFYVWPGLPEWEHRLHEAGLTYLTDNANPRDVTLPTGEVRWISPTTQPLDEEWKHRFTHAHVDQHEEIVNEAQLDVAKWHELSASERRNFLSIWKKRWSWSRSIEELEGDSSESQLPWEAVRVIGHRGCGKSPRPIMY